MTEEQFSTDKERTYPLELIYCENCWCVQTRYIVDPRLLFEQADYHHIAGIPLSFRRNAKGLADNVAKRLNLSRHDLVVDIGSNDGTLLSQFKEYTERILGVDPSVAAKIAIGKGVPTLNVYFDNDTAKRIAKEYGKAKVITAQNVLAHVARLHSLMQGIGTLLNDEGVFISESHYLLDMFEKLQYDFAYHEHLRYYSLTTLVYLFGIFEMDVFDVERISTHAGSIRVYACRKGAYPISSAVTNLMKEEMEAGLFTPATYRQFASRVRQQRVDLANLLKGLKSEGKRIVGLTYPFRGQTLMQFCDIGQNYLEYITDNTPSKIGKYVPCSHVKIVDQEILFHDQPDYGLLMSWHLADEIIPKFREKGFRGKFIIPLPKPLIL